MPLRFATTNLSSIYSQIRHLTASTLHLPQPISPVNPTHLLRVCTVLYQQQDNTDPKLHKHLQDIIIDFHLSHEFFLQVCNKFPYSWKPVYRFFQFTKQSSPLLAHTPITVNKMIDIYGKAKNIQLLWDFLQEAAEGQLVNSKTFMLAIKAFAEARQIKKCVGVFHLIDLHRKPLYTVETLNRMVRMLCLSKLVDEAKDLVSKLKPCIKPDEATYGHLVVGFCRGGDLVRATKVWNLMVEEGFEPEVEAYEEVIETFFKTNKFEDAIGLFKSLRTSKMRDLCLSPYKTLLTWLCKKGNIEMAQMVLAEMIKRGIGIDQPSLGALVYGLLVRKRIREGYMVLKGITEPDISVYHGLIKGLLRLRRAGDATQVFREMTERGCEPIMHTYIMLLQGHLGKRGRKGRDYPLVNFETIFVGGLLKVGKMLEATKYVERMMWGGVQVPRFDYNRFLHSFSNEEGVLMFEEVGKKMRQLGLVDLGDIFLRYGENMTTRDRRRTRVEEFCWDKIVAPRKGLGVEPTQANAQTPCVHLLCATPPGAEAFTDLTIGA